LRPDRGPWPNKAKEKLTLQSPTLKSRRGVERAQLGFWRNSNMGTNSKYYWSPVGCRCRCSLKKPHAPLNSKNLKDMHYTTPTPHSKMVWSSAMGAFKAGTQVGKYAKRAYKYAKTFRAARALKRRPFGISSRSVEE